MHNKKLVSIVAVVLLVAAGFVAFIVRQPARPADHRDEQTFQVVSPGAFSSNTLAYSSQENADGGVTIIVTPKDLSRTAPVWKFNVVMSNHQYDLGQFDLAQLATLTDNAGRSYKATAWAPDTKEGHHVGGTLEFDPEAAGTKNVTLTLAKVGGVDVRIFTWQLQ